MKFFSSLVFISLFSVSYLSVNVFAADPYRMAPHAYLPLSPEQDSQLDLITSTFFKGIDVGGGVIPQKFASQEIVGPTGDKCRAENRKPAEASLEYADEKGTIHTVSYMICQGASIADSGAIVIDGSAKVVTDRRYKNETFALLSPPDSKNNPGCGVTSERVSQQVCVAKPYVVYNAQIPAGRDQVSVSSGSQIISVEPDLVDHNCVYVNFKLGGKGYKRAYVGNSSMPAGDCEESSYFNYHINIFALLPYTVSSDVVKP